ncbi:hypothetical protein ACSU6B_04380 [Neobacillus sp. C211]|uniref:hypothetical protein n=1 Tax=unclassified Neobacillus TaxID=2675272 RepID=UPI003978B64A
MLFLSLISSFFNALNALYAWSVFLNLKGRNPLTPFLELKKPGNLLGIASAVVFGVSMVPSQQLLVHGWVNPVTLYFYRACGIALITYLVYRPNVWFPSLHKHLSLRGITVIIQWIWLKVTSPCSITSFILSKCYKECRELSQQLLFKTPLS